MRYIKTYEILSFREKSKTPELIITTFINLAKHFYPNSNFEIEIDKNRTKYEAGKENIIWKNIQELGIERLNSRGFNRFNWFSVSDEISMEIGFSGPDSLMDKEIMELPINKFLFSVIEKYKWAGNFRSLLINKKNIPSMIEEITIENCEVFINANTYNL